MGGNAFDRMNGIMSFFFFFSFYITSTSNSLTVPDDDAFAVFAFPEDAAVLEGPETPEADHGGACEGADEQQFGDCGRSEEVGEREAVEVAGECNVEQAPGRPAAKQAPRAVRQRPQRLLFEPPYELPVDDAPRISPFEQEQPKQGHGHVEESESLGKDTDTETPACPVGVGAVHDASSFDHGCLEIMGGGVDEMESDMEDEEDGWEAVGRVFRVAK